MTGQPAAHGCAPPRPSRADTPRPPAPAGCRGRRSTPHSAATSWTLPGAWATSRSARAQRNAASRTLPSTGPSAHTLLLGVAVSRCCRPEGAPRPRRGCQAADAGCSRIRTCRRSALRRGWSSRGAENAPSTVLPGPAQWPATGLLPWRRRAPPDRTCSRGRHLKRPQMCLAPQTEPRSLHGFRPAGSTDSTGRILPAQTHLAARRIWTSSRHCPPT